MDFWTDLGFAIVLRVLKDKKQMATFATALLKVFRAIEPHVEALERQAMEDAKRRK